MSCKYENIMTLVKLEDLILTCGSWKEQLWEKNTVLCRNDAFALSSHELLLNLSIAYILCVGILPHGKLLTNSPLE